MKVISDYSSESINQVVKDSFNEADIVFSDMVTSYVDIADYVEVHVTKVFKGNNHSYFKMGAYCN
jgi:hypothetical protein